MYLVCARKHRFTDDLQMLDELKDMICERLSLYKARNKTLPERILVFRDGVSEVRSLTKVLSGS